MLSLSLDALDSLDVTLSTVLVRAATSSGRSFRIVHDIADRLTGYIIRLCLAREGAHVIVPYRDEDDMRHLKVMGDLGKIVPMEIHLRNKDSLEAAVRHSDTVYNLLGRDYETRCGLGTNTTGYTGPLDDCYS
jgi:hypothetical protein